MFLQIFLSIQVYLSVVETQQHKVTFVMEWKNTILWWLE